jgi:predicted RNA-binding Zn ribbon-like protein
MLVTPSVSTGTMRERDKRRIGEQIEPGGRPKAPGRLELLQRFVNTWNHELPAEWDRLGTPTRAMSWLVAKKLVPARTRIGPRDAARLREFREAVRGLVRNRPGIAPDAAAVRTVRRVAAKARLLVAVHASGRTALVPTGHGIYGPVAELLAILHEAHVTGTWPRFKKCRQCGYAFYDRSKNLSATWCAMAICGNRTKNRSYRRRKAAARGR